MILKMGLMMMTTMIMMMMMAVRFVEIYMNVQGGLRGLGGYSGFQVTGMIDWGQKSKPNKILKASYNPPHPPLPKKSLHQKITPKKFHAEFPSLRWNNNSQHCCTNNNVEQWCVLLRPCCSGMQTVQQLPTTCNRVRKRTQHLTS